MAQRITLADVARAAQVSTMTVSRVVNNKDGINAETRRRVQKAIDELGYRPSGIARSLATDRTSTLGLVVPDNASPFFSEVTRGVESIAYAEGYGVFLCNTEEDIQRELAVLRLLEEKQVDGLILVSSRIPDDQLQEVIARHPAVVLINRPPDQNEVASVTIADDLGGRLATGHLLEGGHRAIGFLAGPDFSYSGQQRLIGYQSSLENAGVTANPGWIRHCPPYIATGKETARALLTDHPELTALFCYNDLVAVGALQACRELGRTVPDDLAVVGYDDNLLAALVTPSLTTCRVPKQGLGSSATRLLLDHIKDCVDDCENIVLQPELIIRASAP